MNRLWAEESQLLLWLHEHPDHPDRGGVWDMLIANGKRIDDQSRNELGDWISSRPEDNEPTGNQVYMGGEWL